MIQFPKDFKRITHPVVPNATQWLYEKDDLTISIVGGGNGLYGDGVNTFEYWNFKEEEPKGYLTQEEINELIKSIN